MVMLPEFPSHGEALETEIEYIPHQEDASWLYGGGQGTSGIGQDKPTNSKNGCTYNGGHNFRKLISFVQMHPAAKH